MNDQGQSSREIIKAAQNGATPRRAKCAAR